MRAILAAAAVLLAVFLASNAFAQTDGKPETIIVRMVDKSSAEWRFEPSDLKVEPGDTVRFVQEDIVPHNVEFTDTPDGSNLADAKTGPFLMYKGQTYDLVIDNRFPAGAYKYICTPHAAMGMKGSMKVVSIDGVFASD